MRVLMPEIVVRCRPNSARVSYACLKKQIHARIRSQNDGGDVGRDVRRKIPCLRETLGEKRN